MGVRVATDIGGTFTDLVYLHEETGRVGLAKASTTPGNFAQGVIDTITKAGLDLGEVSYFVHGTTIVINALTERKGCRTALITTRGMRDVLEITRANRPEIYNFRYRKPEPFVPRYLRLEVEERMNARGQVLKELNVEDVYRAVEVCRRENVEAVAVCFIHSYANPEHEKRVGEIIARELPGVALTLSHEIIKEWREYERTNTTVLNAYVQPVAGRYLSSLEGRLKEMGIKCDLHVMQSNGGTATFDFAKKTPIHLVESGPVGGVIGGVVVGRAIGEENIITLDIGGTTAKTSLVEKAEYKVTTDYHIEKTPYWAGYPIKVPVVDIIEIGAGGGSIAWIDNTGVLRVGPQSAGANPGPACYGAGGTQPTVTDANVVAGRINPEYFLGGELKLDVEKAKEAMRPIAAHFRISVEEAALGVIRLANANMFNALKLISVRRGYDPRDFTLIACGGGGSMHAAALARELQIKKVVVPVGPGHFSAFGMLVTDLRHDFIQTEIVRTDQVDAERLNAIYGAMEKEAQEIFAREKIAPDRIVFARAADMRYLGQEHTVKVPVPGGRFTPETVRAVEEKFHELHEMHYTFKLPDSKIEFVNYQLTAFGTVEKPRIAELPAVAGGPERALKGEREVDYDEQGRRMSRIYERDLLGPGMAVEGPAVIEEHAASTVVYPGQRMVVDRFGNLVIYTGV